MCYSIVINYPEKSVESSSFKSNMCDRLDKVLSKELNKSRNQIEKLIKSNLVFVNGKIVAKPSFKVNLDDEISYSFIEAKKESYSDFEIDIQKLYEDEEVLVLNKPAGVVVHPAPSVKEPTLVDWLRKQNIRLSTISGEERNGIVHRLDKDTSGAIIVAKSNFAHESLSAQLQDRSLGRYYTAIINIPLKESIVIDKPIARNPKNRLKMAIVEGGRASKTAFAKVEAGKRGCEVVVAKLYSGRTHQIRVHLSSINRFILGDKLYAPASHKFKTRMMLHARLLYFIHPRSKELVEVEAPFFSDMQEYMDINFSKDLVDEKLSKKSIKNYFNSN